MRKKEESLYGAIKLIKNQVSHLLWRTWATKDHQTDWVQEEKNPWLDYQVCENDWKIHRDL